MAVLVLAEKPSVSQAIAAALGVKGKKDGYIEGNGYIISWCVGHLVELANADNYEARYSRWAREDLPILPENRRRLSYMNAVKSASFPCLSFSRLSGYCSHSYFILKRSISSLLFLFSKYL